MRLKFIMRLSNEWQKNGRNFHVAYTPPFEKSGKMTKII